MPAESWLRRLQTAAMPTAVAAGLLGFLASVGVRLLPLVAPPALWILHAVVAALGVGAGLAAVRRGEEIDARRWEIVQDPALTSGEREYAHKEAERERRWAGTALLAAPLALGYWLAYQAAPGVGVPGHLPPAWALLGFVAGLLAGQLRGRGRDGETGV